MSAPSRTTYKPSDKVQAYLDKKESLGKLPTGTRLPTAEALAAELEVSSGTVKNVYRALAGAGRVKTLVGVGSFWIGSGATPKRVRHIGISLGGSATPPANWWRSSAWVGQVFGGILQRKLDEGLEATLDFCGDLGALPPKEVRERLRPFDGVIALSLTPLPKTLTDADGRTVPYVSLNPPHDNASTNFVSPDYFICSRRLGEAWRKTGRRRILLVTTQQLARSASSRQRYSGLLCGLGEAIGNPLEVRIFNSHGQDDRARLEGLICFLDRGWIPDAVYCTGSGIAHLAADALRLRGLSVPEEVSIVGGSQSGFSTTALNPLTSMIHPLENVGMRLLEKLLARMASGGADEPGVFEPVPFAIGTTTRREENELLVRHSRAISLPPSASLTLSSSTTPLSQPTMSNIETPIPVAIVGLGRAGWHLHLQPILKLPGFKIVAVADPVAERCKEAADLTSCEQYNNIDDLLKETTAKVVVVATPSSLHYQEALKVLKSGRHCILEKPIAMTTEEADEIVKLAKELNLKLFVNHAHLHRHELPYLQEVIKSGILGPVFHIRAFWGGYSRRWDWQTLKKNGGGALNNTCPHMLSIVLPLLGSPVKGLYADLRNIKDAGDAEDHVHLVLKAENGATADIVVSSAIALGAPKWTICGTYGTLQSDGTTAKLRYYNPAKATPLSVLDTAAPDRKYLREELPWEEKEVTIPETTTKPFHENIYDVLTHGATQVVTPESAAEVVRVTELAHKAAAGC